VTRKRRKGFPSESKVKRGNRGVTTSLGSGLTGFKEIIEKLGRNDL
jgi:hypothetical protein